MSYNIQRHAPRIATPPVDFRVDSPVDPRCTSPMFTCMISDVRSKDCHVSSRCPHGSSLELSNGLSCVFVMLFVCCSFRSVVPVAEGRPGVSFQSKDVHSCEFWRAVICPEYQYRIQVGGRSRAGCNRGVLFEPVLAHG